VTLQRFQSSKTKGKHNKNPQFFTFGFEHVTNNIEESLKFSTPCMVYIQHWLNFVEDNHHFFASSNNHFGYNLVTNTISL
jgi:hypothetical protein